MKFQILEAPPNIVDDHLSYMSKKWHEIIPYWKVIDLFKIDWIIIRSKIIINKDFLQKYPNLKYIFRVWVWIDNLDIRLLEEKNIILKNTPWANAQSVAELCLWGLITLLRNTHKKFDNRFDFMWSNLSNKTIWIIGFWNIWKIFYKLIDAFWENYFIIYDPFINPLDFKEKNINFTDSKSYLFQNSDVLSFHVPLLPETKNFLSWQNFKGLKSDVKIINSSRWWIVNEIDLISFLKNHPNAWAFLDTWEGEPEDPKKELLCLDNCVITPHIWAMTLESNMRMHLFEI